MEGMGLSTLSAPEQQAWKLQSWPVRCLPSLGLEWGMWLPSSPCFWGNKNIVTPKILRLWDLLVKFLLLFLGVTLGRI